MLLRLSRCLIGITFGSFRHHMGQPSMYSVQMSVRRRDSQAALRPRLVRMQTGLKCYKHTVTVLNVHPIHPAPIERVSPQCTAPQKSDSDAPSNSERSTQVNRLSHSIK